MNITKDIISDLLPLYAANECSADTRALVDDYLRQNPREAAEFRRILDTPVPGIPIPAAGLDEMRALQAARRRLKQRSWAMSMAIFFSLAPFSFMHTDTRTYWLFLEAPKSALVYWVLGAVCWTVVLAFRRNSRDL